MKIQSYKIYILLLIVFVLSWAITASIPGDILKGFTATPAVASLIAAIYQLLRDQSAFEKNKHLQRQQQIFNLGATSYMAEATFNKHAEFCEKYMKEVHEMVTTLFAHGPSEKIDKNLFSLVEIQREYAAWVPKEIVLELAPFQKAINEISALSGLSSSLSGEEPNGRNSAIKKMYSIFHNVLNIQDKEVTEENKDIAVEEVKEKIRSILGINELTKLRKLIISESIEFIEKNA